MAVDPSRASLVVQEYRYATAPAASTGAAIKAVFDKARVIEITTYLDQAGGNALANDIATMTDNFVRTFTVTIEGALYPEDFKDGPPRYILNFPRHASVGNKAYSVVGVKVDYFNDRTVLTVRGS